MKRMKWSLGGTKRRLGANFFHSTHNICRSREENETVTALFYYGPREDCIGSSCYNIQSLLHLHKYGILSTQGSPGLHDFGENVREGAIEYWQWRTVPWIEFIIRDKERKRVAFITKMLEDERLTISVVDGSTGEPCFGTENRETILDISRSAKQKADLQRAKWEVKSTSPKVGRWDPELKTFVLRTSRQLRTNAYIYASSL
ncbi:hypothetical protein EDB81DRAFT_832949 [Dactylonectria macrodidyma]|uniref:Uncharacterized protein n=1 Tax=Dactylonectria macrodidyma TaxID=307937 RepID=A0A9P9CZQ2_9HYPO|nr:hypothetical protein EDB81DRAFT_832949 [Dactylonectria macrodidyma]